MVVPAWVRQLVEICPAAWIREAVCRPASLSPVGGVMMATHLLDLEGSCIDFPLQ